METKHIPISDFDYPLPDERIAKFPLLQRDQSKLLIYNKGEIIEERFSNIGKYLPKGALMVFNNTKVIQARLNFFKETGARIEIFILEPAFPHDYQENFMQQHTCSWYCLVGNLKKWKEGSLVQEVSLQGKIYHLSATLKASHGTSFLVEFSWEKGPSWAEVLEAVGELPIPPYLNRATQESDLKTYQTVYSKIKGSVAAPTAGLHFTEDVLHQLDNLGIVRDEITLHVGAGTFKPVKSESIGMHDMHTEHIAVTRTTIEHLIAHQGKAIAVGTTSVRTLESLYYMGVLASKGMDDLHVPQWMPYENQDEMSVLDSLYALKKYMDNQAIDVLHSSTQIIIAPGYSYHIVERIVTNFHQPKSTLLLLVSAFLQGDWRKVYDFALSHDFRFLSYGDSSLLIP